MLTYEQEKNSCRWMPGQAQEWYDMGYQTGLTLYAGHTDAEIQYGLNYYTQRGRLTYGSYEQGIADGIRAMIEVTA